MCEKCKETVKLIEQTRSGESVVAFSFPNGKPILVERPKPKSEVRND